MSYWACARASEGPSFWARSQSRWAWYSLAFACSRSALRHLQGGLGLLNLGVGLGGLGRVERVVDLRQHGAGLDVRAVVDGLAVRVLAEGEDLAGDLGADVDHFLRLDRAGGADGNQQVAARHLGGAECNGLIAVPLEVPRGRTAHQSRAGPAQ